MKTNSLTIPWWFDRHVHVRRGGMLKAVLPCTLNQCTTGAVIMGNLPHPHQTSTIENAVAYRDEIAALIPEGSGFKPRMTLYLTDEITPDEVERGFKEGVWCAAKLYMADQNGQGGTTGSQHGVRNLLGRYPVFERMEEIGMPLLGHFEAVEEEVDEFDREIISIERDLEPLLWKFTKLPIVVEHITDSRAADFVAEADHDIQATVTAHHLIINRNSMFRCKDQAKMNPFHWCKPVPKREKHRLGVRKHVTSGNKRFGAGTDSAPHDVEAKLSCCGCAAGIFTAPTAVELYATVFDEDDAMEHLGGFLSENFLRLYGMETSRTMMTLERLPLVIPETVGTVKVFRGGKTLPWTLIK